MHSQHRIVRKETDPSILSQILSRSLAAWVFTTMLFYLSQVSKAKSIKASGSLIIVSNSDSLEANITILTYIIKPLN